MLSWQVGSHLFGDVVDGVQAQAGVGFHQSVRADHHVHQPGPYTTPTLKAMLVSYKLSGACCATCHPSSFAARHSLHIMTTNLNCFACFLHVMQHQHEYASSTCTSHGNGWPQAS